MGGGGSQNESTVASSKVGWLPALLWSAANSAGIRMCCGDIAVWGEGGEAVVAYKLFAEPLSPHAR